MIEKYKHIIWDWNGTIFNDVVLSHDIISRLMIQYNIKAISLDEYKDAFTIPVRDYYEKIGFDFEKEPFEIVGRKWMDEYERRKFECGLYKEIISVLKKIKSSGLNQSILSAYSQHTLDEMVEYFRLKEYFANVVGLDNIYAASKLHLGVNLIKEIGNKKGEVLLIGDTIHDLEVATEIGVDCVLLSCGHQSYRKLFEFSRQYGEIPILSSIDELLN